MSDRDDEPGRSVDRKALIWVSGYLAPVLASLLCEAEARFKSDPLLGANVKALRDDIERQVHEQFPGRGWLFKHND